MGNAQCDPGTANHYNVGDFPFISSSGVTVTMAGTNSGTAGPYSAFGCSPATIDPNSIRLDPGDTLIFNFSQLVHEVTFISGAMNASENGIILTNNGIPSLSSNCPQDVVITGNAYALDSLAALASPTITITIPNGATSISIACLPASNNGIFTIDMLDCISSCNTSSNITLSACDSLISPSGNYTWATSGTYNDTIANSLSCDSVISINLTILNSSVGTDTLVACDSLTWIDGNTYTTSNNTATHTLSNSVGCDSIIFLDLTINNASINAGPDQIACSGCSGIPDDSVMLSASGALSFSWDNGITDSAYFSIGHTTIYTVTGTDTNGCTGTDSVTVYVGARSCMPIALTGLDSVTHSGQTYYQSSIDTIYHTNAAGCDSIEYLDITINHTGFGENVLKNIEIYPNPTSSIVNIKGLNSLNELSYIHLLNYQGALISKIRINETEIDLSLLSTGIYFIEIKHQQGIGRIKLVKQ